MTRSPEARPRDRGKVLLAGIVAAAGFAATMPAAHATFPGSNGRIFFESIRDGDMEIYSMAPDGSDVTQLTANTTHDRFPAVSADGTRVAFASERDGNFEIYTMNADGSGQARLTSDPAYDGNPSWSPDGTKIVFTSNRDGDYEIFVMNADGSGLVQLTANSVVDAGPQWSPDGSKITFDVGEGGSAEIFVMNADGSGRTQLTSNGFQDGLTNWSPDGMKIAFRRDGAGGWAEIYVMNPDGSGQTNISNHPAYESDAAWSPDGTKLVFASNRDGGDFDIYTMNADGSGQVRINAAPGQDTSFDWAVAGSPADTTPPAITTTAPAAAGYLLNQAVAADYTCTDAGSGVASCTGPVPDGAPVATSAVGAHTFTVDAADNAGNTASRSVDYTVAYKICQLYDPAKPAKKGSTLPIKIQLCDAGDANTSAPRIMVTAQSVTQTSTSTSAPAEDSGNANPGNHFRYDPTLGATGGYIYNLSTKSLAPGGYTLGFTVGTDPTTYTVPFQVR